MLLLIHGGAGNRRPGKRALTKLSEALSTGFNILNGGGTALDTVRETVQILEDSGLFNAGVGGKSQIDEIRRLDASLMEGKYLKAGSVVGLEGIRNPINVARHIMDLPHVILSNIGARRIAEVEHLERLPEADKRTVKRKENMKRRKKGFMRAYEKYFSTVGATALDQHGNLAAGTSTGGIMEMLPGRVGDTPVIGAGTYAENSSGAVSCTGAGEYIVRIALAKEICMHLKSMTPQRAAKLSLQKLSRIGGNAGVIVINRKEKFTIMHTTEYMASGYINKDRIIVRDSFRRLKV